MSERPISEVFTLIVDIALANGAVNIKDLSECWTFQEGNTFIAVNGRDERRTVTPPSGIEIAIEPFGAIIMMEGWPVFMGNPFSGMVIMITEDELINRLKDLSARQSFQE